MCDMGTRLGDLQHGIDNNGNREPSVKMAHWNDGIKNLHAHDPPLIDDLPSLMGRLKNDYGFQIAICTSDDRSSTDSSIQNWNLKDLVNVRNLACFEALSIETVNLTTSFVHDAP